jgi:16S rRNA (cytidine1402-2'-O)-methyltransferase
MGTLYIVGTPIGNLEDMTFRAARILGQVSLVAAEDTRVARKLLNHLGIHVPLTSYHEHNRLERIPVLLAALKSGDVALVTDAGMPGISDPGDELVAQAAAAGFPVESVPGVSAVTAALAVSGFPAEPFIFLGFLPRRSKDRRARLETISKSILQHTPGTTLVLFEAPHRLRATLEDLRSELGEWEIVACRELTKLHEEIFRGTITQALQHFQEPRGEFVLVVRPHQTPSLKKEEGETASAVRSDLDMARQQLAEMKASGAHARDAVAAVAGSLGLSRQTVYRLWLEVDSVTESPGGG